MDKKQTDVQVIAANLTAAAHVHMLSMQLRGERVTLDEAIEAVSATYRHLIANPHLFGAAERQEPPDDTPRSIFMPPQAPHTETTDPSVTDYTAPRPVPDTTLAPGNGTVVERVAPPPALETMIGRVIDGRYRILQSLGAGGMGQVYLGEQLSTGRKVALKTMHTLTPGDLSSALRFFQQEAASLARLNHPNIAQIYDASVAGNNLFIAMEYIEGEMLRNRMIRNGKLPIADAVRIIRETCTGLESAHRLGIIHRDIKPENLMIVRDENERMHVKILDFGLAILDDKDAMENCTGAGAIAGTPTYMSPEQVNGEAVTPATDIYSLGIVAYEMLTGVNPFRGANVMQTMQNHLQMDPPPIRHYNPQVPQELEESILRALEKDPQQRFTDGGEWRRVF